MNYNIEENYGKQKKIFRVSLLGPSGVGKTTLVNLLRHGHYEQQKYSSIGTSFYRYTFDKNKTIDFWDNPGQERFRHILWEMNKRFKAFIFIFDLSNGESFSQINQWLLQFQEKIQINKIIFYAFGNKTDLQRAIDKDFIENFWEQKGIPYHEISFKQNDNTKKVIDRILSQIWFKCAFFQLQQQKNFKKNIKLEDSNNMDDMKLKNKCC